MFHMGHRSTRIQRSLPLRLSGPCTLFAAKVAGSASLAGAPPTPTCSLLCGLQPGMCLLYNCVPQVGTLWGGHVLQQHTQRCSSDCSAGRINALGGEVRQGGVALQATGRGCAKKPRVLGQSQPQQCCPERCAEERCAAGLSHPRQGSQAMDLGKVRHAARRTGQLCPPSKNCNSAGVAGSTASASGARLCRQSVTMLLADPPSRHAAHTQDSCAHLV